MIKNYLLSAYASLARQKLFALINVFGLAIALCVFILISLYVKKEYSYDSQWRNADRITWLLNEFKLNESTSFKSPAAPYPAMPLLRQYFVDEFEFSARSISRGEYIVIGENRFQGRINHVEKDFINIFSFELVSGSLEASLEIPGRVALTEELASNYFGSDDPIGQTLTLQISDSELVDYQVSAVFRLPEGGSSFSFSAFSLLDATSLVSMGDELNRWDRPTFVPHYFLVKESAEVEKMNLRMLDFFAEYVEQASPISSSYEFQPLSEVHFDSNLGIGRGDQTRVNTFAIIALLVLLIGSTNFIILATAKADERQREVGVRKVLGAKNSELIVQFMAESVLFTFVALIVAVVLVKLCLPFFSSLMSEELSFSFFEPLTLLSLLMMTTMVGVFGGVYPALVLSSFQPVKALNVSEMSTKRSKLGSFGLRTILVISQFTIATIMIIATMTLYLQLSFTRDKDLGFNPENLIAIDLYNAGIRENITPLVNELQSLPGVEQIALSTMQAVIRGSSSFTAGKFVRDLNTEDGVDYQGFWVDYDFFDVYQINFLAGRPYDLLQDGPRENTEDETSESANPTKIIINNFLAQALGFSPVDRATGQIIYQQVTSIDGEKFDIEYIIVGVVEDSKFRSLREPISAESYLLSTINSSILTLRYSNSAGSTINEEVEKVWQTVMGEAVMRSSFVSQNVQQEFLQEENEGKLLMTFSMLCIFISCLGLYGLVAFTVKKRKKEIGIRKVLGANFNSIMLFFIWQFSKPVLAANVIAWPIAVWAMLKWLQRFPDQISYLTLLPLCLIAGLVALVIAVVTVAITVAKAAKSDPVLSLRYE